MQLGRLLRRGASTRKRIVGICVLSFFAVGAVALAAANFHQVKPINFDPVKTHLVNGGWVLGAGCPTDASTTSTGTKPADGTYTDSACTTGDSKDKKNEGLLLVKTGPQANFAVGAAELKDVKGITLTELGYDIRHGSHCGAGAPRFNVTTTSGTTYFVGCSSPPPDSATTGDQFDRLRWGNGSAGSVSGFNQSNGNLEPITDPVQSIALVFDESDPGISAAVLDNVDVNGTLVGQGQHPDEG